jgi:hypothetical protein
VDYDGVITRLELFADNVKLGESTNGSIGFVFTNASIAVHTVTARAYGRSGSEQQCDTGNLYSGSRAAAITSQPQSLFVIAGVNPRSRFGALGSPPLVFQWRLNGTNLPNATSNSYTITNAQP